MSRLDHMGEDFDKDDEEIGNFNLAGIMFNFALGWLMARWSFWLILAVLMSVSYMLIGRK